MIFKGAAYILGSSQNFLSKEFMLWLKKFTKTIYKFVALFVLLYTCNILLCVDLFRAYHALKD